MILSKMQIPVYLHLIALNFISSCGKVLEMESSRTGRRNTYLIETPKHFVAIAASKKTAALGKVSCEIAWNDACLPFVCAAQSESRYSPNDATPPESTHVTIPGSIPLEAMACQRSENKRGSVNG